MSKKPVLPKLRNLPRADSEPWSLGRVQRLIVVVPSEEGLFVGGDEALQSCLDDVDWEVDGCTKVVQAVKVRQPPSDHTPPIPAQLESHSVSSDPPIDESLYDVMLSSDDPSPRQFALELNTDGKSPFEMIADFNRKSPTQKLDYFNRPIIGQESSPYRIGKRGSPPPADMKPVVGLAGSTVETILKSLRGMRERGEAEEDRIGRLEAMLEEIQWEEGSRHDAH